MIIVYTLGIIASCFVLMSLLIASNKPVACPKCKKVSETIEKGYDYHSEYYCSNCGHEYDLTKG